MCPYGDIDRRECILRLENRDTRERTHLFKILLNHMPTIVTRVITLTRRVRELELDQCLVVLRDVAERAAPLPLSCSYSPRPPAMPPGHSWQFEAECVELRLKPQLEAAR